MALAIAFKNKALNATLSQTQLSAQYSRPDYALNTYKNFVAQASNSTELDFYVDFDQPELVNIIYLLTTAAADTTVEIKTYLDDVLQKTYSGQLEDLTKNLYELEFGIERLVSTYQDRIGQAIYLDSHECDKVHIRLANSAGNVGISYLFVSHTFEHNVDMNYGWSIDYVDESEYRTTQGGSNIVIPGSVHRSQQFKLDYLNDKEALMWLEVQRFVGKRYPILVCSDNEHVSQRMQNHFTFLAFCDISPVTRRNATNYSISVQMRGM